MAQYRQQEDFWNAMAASFQQPGQMGAYTIGRRFCAIGNSTDIEQQAAPPAPAAPARPKPGDIGERGEWQGVEMDGLAKGDVLRRREDGELVNERTGKVDGRPWALDASPFVIPRDLPNKPKPGDIIHDSKMLEVGMVVECTDTGMSGCRHTVGVSSYTALDMLATNPVGGVRVVSVPWEAEKPGDLKLRRMPAVGERWRWKGTIGSRFDVVEVRDAGDVRLMYGDGSNHCLPVSTVAERAEYVGPTPVVGAEVPIPPDWRERIAARMLAEAFSAPAHDFSDPYCHTTADSPEARVPRCKVCGSVEAKGSVLWRAMCEPTKWREAGDRLVAEATSAVDYPTRAPRRFVAPEPMRSGLGSIGCRMTGSRR